MLRKIWIQQKSRPFNIWVILTVEKVQKEIDVADLADYIYIYIYINRAFYFGA